MAQAARRITAKDADAKLARRRLTVLELAERLGNEAEACGAGGSTARAFMTGSGASNCRPRRSEGPAADRQEPPDDHAAGGGRADRRTGAAPSGLRL